LKNKLRLAGLKENKT